MGIIINNNGDDDEECEIILSDPEQVELSERILREAGVIRDATLEEQINALVEHAEKKWGNG